MALPRTAQIQKAKPRPETWLELWETLSSDDAHRAYKALNEFSSYPLEAMRLIGSRVQVVQGPDEKELSRIVKSLADDQFNVRRNAQSDLLKLNELAVPVLERRLQEECNLEEYQAITSILKKCTECPPNQLRVLRCIHILENVATPEALEILESLSKGARASRVTQGAREALLRLSKSKMPKEE
jgi:hypothetical protein